MLEAAIAKPEALLFVQQDVAEEDWHRALAAPYDRFGALDVQVNNAAASASAMAAFVTGGIFSIDGGYQT